jgi:hypothetical protein
MAKALGIAQDSVSRLEKRSGLLLSTLRKTVEAMGLVRGQVRTVVEDRAPGVYEVEFAGDKRKNLCHGRIASRAVNAAAPWVLNRFGDSWPKPLPDGAPSGPGSEMGALIAQGLPSRERKRAPLHHEPVHQGGLAPLH